MLILVMNMHDMARPIKATPVLSGEAISIFLNQLNENENKTVSFTEYMIDKQVLLKLQAFGPRWDGS